MKNFLDEFLKNVAWPAVAGNVAWSFATLAIDHDKNVNTAPRLGVLFVLAIYLSAEWYRSKEINNTISGLCLDLLFVICIVWFAIATQADKGLPGVALLIILVGVSVGHFFEVWPPAGKGKGNYPHATVSLLAACFLGGAWWMNCSWNWWFALVAIIIVLVVWACVRRNKTS
ncbi:MAG: hypothetical protein KC643_20000 [Nitrospira sp.]|nr:hypothetical protein [Nitrospira sp.]